MSELGQRESAYVERLELETVDKAELEVVDEVVELELEALVRLKLSSLLLLLLSSAGSRHEGKIRGKKTKRLLVKDQGPDTAVGTGNSDDFLHVADTRQVAGTNTSGSSGTRCGTRFNRVCTGRAEITTRVVGGTLECVAGGTDSDG